MTTMTDLWQQVDGEHVAASLGEICAALQDAPDASGTGARETDIIGEIFIDFAAVRRLDADAVRALEALAAVAQEKQMKLVLRGVNVEVYRVLKLVKLAKRYSFVA